MFERAKEKIDEVSGRADSRGLHAVSELCSVVELLRSERLGDLADGSLEQEFSELHGSIEQLEVERLRRLSEIERRGLHGRDGHLSVASWLSDRHKVSAGSAKRQVRLAGVLQEMPATRRALEASEVSLSSARVLAAAREDDPEAFSGSERVLVDVARVHSVEGLKRAAAVWRERVVSERSGDLEEVLRARRGLHTSVRSLGMVRAEGDLDPENGETLLTALQAQMDAEARGGKEDPRTLAQRRADALGEICRRFLDHGDRPAVAGERPHLTLTVDVQALGERPDVSSRAEAAADPQLDHTGPVGIALARRLSCDASVMRVVMAGPREPIEVGRRTPVVPAAIRRAVVVRDRGCRFPGCDRPSPWCDAHHAIHWADGGNTSLSNLVLLCRPHHRMVHQHGGFGLEMNEGTPVFRRPDGTVLEDRAPP
jgi:hypothetical protein